MVSRTFRFLVIWIIIDWVFSRTHRHRPRHTFITIQIACVLLNHYWKTTVQHSALLSQEQMILFLSGESKCFALEGINKYFIVWGTSKGFILWDKDKVILWCRADISVLEMRANAFFFEIKANILFFHCCKFIWRSEMYIDFVP